MTTRVYPARHKNSLSPRSSCASHAEQTRDLSYFRYHRGLVSYLDVTDAERELLQARQNYALAIGHRYFQTVKLVEALGGGWEIKQKTLNDKLLHLLLFYILLHKLKTKQIN